MNIPRIQKNMNNINKIYGEWSLNATTSAVIQIQIQIL